MSKRNLVMIIALLLVIPVMLVGCGKSEPDAVKDSLKGFTSAYNSGDYEKCTDYLSDVTDATTKGLATGALERMKLIVDSFEIVSFEAVNVDGSSATAKVKARVTLAAGLGGQATEQSISVPLTKVDGKWKFSLASLPNLEG